ncbi:hypothetical protein [Paludibacterium yongneupense]|uniref:hypothetical protein n=1 Tax=Paludibacterium yongneupense TaxID=400061 RepID=UPI00042780E9|nr:hypothetical protein [Paludibacterium yongneupense]
MKTLPLLGALLVGLLSAAAHADEAPPPMPGHAHPPMMMSPPQAVALCQGKASGAAVHWTAPDGKVLNGHCLLAFVPEHPLDAPPPESGH